MSTAVVLLSASIARVAPAEEPPVLKTFSSVGKESRALDGGREAELLRHDGKGCLTHMWFGGDFYDPLKSSVACGFSFMGGCSFHHSDGDRDDEAVVSLRHD